MIAAKNFNEMAIEKKIENFNLSCFRQKRMPSKVKKTEIMSYPPSKKTEKTTNGEVANKVLAEKVLLTNK